MTSEVTRTPVLRMILTTLAALAVGLAGGALFRYLNSPLPWTLGSLAAAAILAISGSSWRLPTKMRDGARPVVGVLAGSAFTPQVIASIAEWWGIIILVAVYALSMCGIGWVFFRLICRFDRVTAFFASMPAGLGEFTLLGGILGGSMRTLVVIHAIRVVGVVFTVPFLLQWLMGQHLGTVTRPVQEVLSVEAIDWLILIGCGVIGYIIGKALRFSMGVMLLPMLLSAVVHGMGLTDVLPPAWLVALVQIVIGSIAGSRFAGVTMHELRSTAFQALAWTVIVLAAATGMAALGAYLFDVSYPGLLLALAPAGMPEMTIISYALGVETALVVTCQIFRLMLILTLAPLAFRAFAGPQPDGQDKT